jgi:hypothetical protein
MNNKNKNIGPSFSLEHTYLWHTMLHFHACRSVTVFWKNYCNQCPLMCSMSSFLGSNVTGGEKLTTHLLLVPRWRMVEAFFNSPHIFIMWWLFNYVQEQLYHYLYLSELWFPCCMINSNFLLGLLFNPENGGKMMIDFQWTAWHYIQ